MAAAMRWAAAALTVAVTSVLGAAPASADVPVPFTITETIDFGVEGPQAFTATGPLCDAGTFVDTPRVFAAFKGRADKVIIRFDTVYTCSDGSGTFSARKLVVITPTGEDSSINSGPFTLQGGTGDYAGIVGHGVDIGEASGGMGVGHISGYVVR